MTKTGKCWCNVAILNCHMAQNEKVLYSTHIQCAVVIRKYHMAQNETACKRN